MFFKDGLAIAREYGKPDLFITMTCNPKWPEIKAGLFPGQVPADRPDLIARVFKRKQTRLLDDLIKKQLFGPVVGYIWVVEFQKRGLPHMHLLLWLSESAKIRTADETDQIIRAEFIDTSTLEEGPDKEMAEKLNKLASFCLNFFKNFSFHHTILKLLKIYFLK